MNDDGRFVPAELSDLKQLVVDTLADPASYGHAYFDLRCAFDRAVIEASLTMGLNQKQMAEALGITRVMLRAKLHRAGIVVPDGRRRGWVNGAPPS